MKKAAVYTKTGDKGTTGLVGGTRIKKSDPRIHLYGEVDELNSSIGAAAAFLDESFDKNFQIPKGKKFSIKDLSDEYGVPYSKIYSAVKLLGDKIKKVSEIKNKKGKPTTIYLLE